MRRILALSCLCFAIACGDDEPTESLDSGTAVPSDSGVVDNDAGVPRDGGGIALGRVELSSDTIDLGAVVVTSTAMASMTITNTGDDPVQVTISELFGPDAARFKRSLNTPDENGTFNIEAQGVVTLTVSVSPADFGPLLAVIALDSCAGACPSAIVLQALGVETGIVCPFGETFGLVNPGNCSDFDVRCENRGNATERVTVVELEPTSSQDYSITEPALPADLGPGDVLTIPTRFCPSDIGIESGSIRVATFRPFETEHVIRLEGVGGGSDVACTPDQLSFGTVGVGAVISQTLTCRNTGSDAAFLSLAVATGTHFSVRNASLEIPTNGTALIEISAMPQMTGTLTDLLRINTNDPDSPIIEVPLSVESITADPCTAVLEPATRDFGLVGIGESRRARLTATNIGNSVCLVRGAALAAGSSPTIRVISAPAVGTAIQAGETFDVEVEFTPTMNAIASGTLTVSFSNPGTSELTAALTGTGGLAPVRITPASIDFGAAPVACAAPLTQRVSLERTLAGTGPISSVTIANESTPGVFSVLDTGALPVTIALGEGLTFNVGFSPPAAGVYTAELSILAGGLPTPIRVPISGEGVSAATRTETFSLASRKVDVLFVIDNGESMGAAQVALAAAMSGFDQVLAERGADFHFGVITTDMEEPQQQGRLVGVTPYLETRDLADLIARVQPGSDGADESRPFDAVQAALTNPIAANENAGFRRADAELAIVFIGDDDDESTAAPSISQRVLELRAIAGNNPLHVSAIVGPPNAGCAGRIGAAEAGSRYAQLVLRAGGTLYSFCSDLDKNVRELAGDIFGAPIFPLALEPRVQSIEVAVNASTAGGWAFDLSSRSVRFADGSAVPAGATVEVTYAPFCLSATCGNGTIDANEECDDNNSADDDACTSRCLDARCGDGISQAVAEACDDANLDDTDDCISTCSVATCGDGFLLAGVEECDDNNTTPGDGCPATCRFYLATPLAPRNYTPLTAAIPLVFEAGGESDDGVTTLTLPFSFRFYDVPTSTLTISVNGLISVAEIDPGDSYDNVTFPDVAEPNGLIAAWWDDLYFDPAVAGAAIGYEIQGTAPDRVAVIEWHDVRLQGHSTNNHRRFTFQIRLEETTNVIRIRYEETETTGNPPTATSASIGIEDHFGLSGLDPVQCSPSCAGPPRPQNANGFPEQTELVFTP